MDLRRLRVGEWLLLAAGLALAVSLFLPWYDVGPDFVARGAPFSAWETFTIVDILLFATAALALLIPLLIAANPNPNAGVAAEALLTLLALIASIVVLIRFLNLPGPFDELGGTRQAGAWLGLLSTFAILAGGLIGMRDERLGSPADAPEVETLATPPASA